ncbi:MAG: hypothetical protein NT070_06410 [Cyanobacteria bacterium]|nr:hypothetical protein [Cyanobacteriota bacterium]
MRPPVKTTLLKTTLLSAMSTVAILIPIVLQANAAIAGDKIYKIEIRQTNATSHTLEGESYKKIRGRSEWAVLMVNEDGTVQLKHMIRTTQSYGVSTWSDHVVTALNVCPVIDKRSACGGLKGDRFTLPKGNSIKDFQFEFQVQENNGSQVRFVQVPRDFIAEELPAVDNSRSRSVRK